MAALKIPERYRPGFAVLAGLSDSSFDEFFTAVRQAPHTFANRREFEAWIGAEVKTISPSDLSRLVESITSFYRLQSRFSMSATQLAEGLAEGAKESIENINPDIDVAKRIAALLALDAFNITSIKAKELQTQAERIFIEARVLTDVRPVFGETIEAAPPAVIVVHTLKIVTHESDGHKEYFIALDEADIRSLRTALERAEMKSNSLKALLDLKGLQSIDLSKEE